MKKFIITGQLLIILVMVSTMQFGQSVEKEWLISPHSVDFDSTPPVVSILPNQSPYEYTDSNGAFDDEGNLLFYIIDAQVYNNTSNFVGLLLEANSGYSLPIRETNIVPVPGNNNQFYVIYSFGRAYEGQDLLYATIDCSGNNCSILNNANLLSHYVYGNNNGVAVSRLFSDNTRRMYLASNDYIKRFEIRSTGIIFQENLLVYPNDYGLASYDFDAVQLELSNDCSKLAWVALII